MIQPRNGYNQHYFSLDCTFLTCQLRPNALGQGQLVEAEAKILASRPIYSRGVNITGISLLLLTNINSYFKYNTENILCDFWCYTCVDNDKRGPQSGCLHVFSICVSLGRGASSAMDASVVSQLIELGPLILL